ncbi:MAG: WbqC family protein [Bacteroidetes bacterium]|nr:WbqC family protein [Bacteroidota bacterium]
MEIKNEINSNKIILSTAYWPNIAYLSQLIFAKQFVIEKHENFVKQTYRNRCVILTANGKQNLIIPVESKSNQVISEVKISYKEDWQKQHWRAIQSAYKNAPFFEFFESELEHFYNTKYERLFEFNTELLKWLLNSIRVKKEILLTNTYNKIYTEAKDYRNILNSKVLNNNVSESIKYEYYQVFADKFGFQSNLSSIDLLFNCGMKYKNYLI